MRKSIITITVLLVMMGCSQVCFAGASSLTIDFRIEDQGVATVISGAEFTIYRAGEYDEKTRGFSSRYGIRVEELDTSGNRSLAEELLEKVSGGISKKTGADGKAVFRGLEPGIYVVSQTGRSGAAREYNKVDPYIITIPAMVNGELTYDVESLPKTDIVKSAQRAEPDPPQAGPGTDEKPGPAARSGSVDTGDSSALAGLLALMLTSILTLGVMQYIRESEQTQEGL